MEQDLQTKYEDLKKVVDEIKTKADEAYRKTSDQERTKLNRNIDEDSKRIIREIAGAGGTSFALCAGRMYQNANQSISTSSDTQVALDGISFENGVDCDASTNRINILSNGIYQISSQVSYESPVANKLTQASMFINGSLGSSSQAITVTTDRMDVSTFWVGELVAGDYIELFTFHNCGVSESLQTGSSYTFLQVIGG